jgi:hypothetical protein
VTFPEALGVLVFTAMTVALQYSANRWGHGKGGKKNDHDDEED